MKNIINIKILFKNILQKSNSFSLIIIFSIFLVDRYSKNKVINNFSENIYFINDFININLIWNNGIGFGLLSTNSLIWYNFVTLIIGAVIVIVFFFLINSNTLNKFIYSLIIGGAVGNFYDRIMYYSVPDFIDIHYNKLHWFTFNFADIFISIGIFAYMISSFFVKVKDEK